MLSAGFQNTYKPQASELLEGSLATIAEVMHPSTPGGGGIALNALHARVASVSSAYYERLE
jgi:hypothetical protein